MTENADKIFTDAFRESITSNTFVKATLGNYRGNEPDLQKIFVRRLSTSKGERIELLSRYKTRDISKNYGVSEALTILTSHLQDGFCSAHLFTSSANFQLTRNKKGAFHLSKSKPTSELTQTQTHDREKQRVIDSSRSYLNALGITTAEGIIKTGQQQKWKQINKFVETIGSLFDEIGFEPERGIRIVDMGCGKGYLTFALFDYLVNTRGLNVTITGVDANANLVAFCNKLAAESGFKGLSFHTGTILDTDFKPIDVLIALHACDTATDDALFKGIAANAKLIVASPCCHKEIRPQIKAPAEFADVLRHGSLMERQAELITDGLRALLLEENGYKTKVFEFVPTEHTPKNNLITAIQTKHDHDPIRFRNQIDSLKTQFGIESIQLEKLLSQK